MRIATPASATRAPPRRLAVNRSCRAQPATSTENTVVIALRIDANPLLMWISDHTISVKGTKLLSVPMTKNDRQISGARGHRWPIASSTRLNAAADTTRRRATMVSGGSSNSKTLKKKNDPPQISDRNNSDIQVAVFIVCVGAARMQHIVAAGASALNPIYAAEQRKIYLSFLKRSSGRSARETRRCHCFMRRRCCQRSNCSLKLGPRREGRSEMRPTVNQYANAAVTGTTMRAFTGLPYMPARPNSSKAIANRPSQRAWTGKKYSSTVAYGFIAANATTSDIRLPTMP